MTTSSFTSSITDQVRLNLIHYNLWTQVKSHNEYILSGLPQTKLVATDPNTKREWIVCKRLNENSKLKVKEINSWFEEIKHFTSGVEENGGDIKQNIDSQSDVQSKDDLQSLGINGNTNESDNGDRNAVSSEPNSNRLSHSNYFSPSSPFSKWKPIDKTTNGKGRVDRITIALINDDGTIVYYFIHDGITKPRQN
ncbi:SEN15 [Candida margitis]|uniref:SEN15 n=1 Tax=Candida margitis TaxID=1775924 RepID=UPI0022262A8C|nr:SEN15 [Candida margitis]KAI5969477.1 SEN15 [Candida margitis]